MSRISLERGCSSFLMPFAGPHPSLGHPCREKLNGSIPKGTYPSNDVESLNIHLVSFLFAVIAFRDYSHWCQLCSSLMNIYISTDCSWSLFWILAIIEDFWNISSRGINCYLSLSLPLVAFKCILYSLSYHFTKVNGWLFLKSGCSKTSYISHANLISTWEGRNQVVPSFISRLNARAVRLIQLYLPPLQSTIPYIDSDYPSPVQVVWYKKNTAFVATLQPSIDFPLL